MPYVSGVISEQTRVLHAALQLTTFTLEQLAGLAGLEQPVAEAVVERSRDMIEEVSSRARESRERLAAGGDVGSDAPPPQLYRLRESARPRLTREAVDLADRLRGAPRASVQETARTASIALDAAESAVELMKLVDCDRRAWADRAVVQLELARRLVVLVKDSTWRASLRRRAVHLAGCLEGIPLPVPPKAPASAQRPAPKPFKTPSPPSSRAPRTVWRSANRRLYDAVERRFITLEDVRRLVNEEVDFVVIDKRGKGDITQSILLQIITEREEQGPPVMTREFLMELIRCHRSEPQELLAGYLEHIFTVFAAEHATRP
jgi:polyhydroxyalkanoate synthesis repressor PhaR